MKIDKRRNVWVKLLLWFHLLYEVTSINAAIRLSIYPEDSLKVGLDSVMFLTSKNVLHWNEGRPLNLTCAVQVADSMSGFRNFNDSSENKVPHYEINWYLPDPHLKDKYLFEGGFNQHTLVIQDTRMFYSGTYKCTAINKAFNDAYPSSLAREVLIRINPNSEGRIPSCGKHFFQCFNNAHHCIPKRYTCDGFQDCYDGSDESKEECGLADPCAAKLRCEHGRCMDPAQCCDPTMDPSCTILQDCCVALIESGRQFYKLGVERRNNQDLKFLHSTIYTVTGCVVAFLLLLLLVTMAVCRLHAKRGWSWRYALGQTGPNGTNPRGAGRAHPPITLHDLDIYFASLRRVDSRHSLAGGHGITYNINNGVQIVGGPPLPPPYSAAVIGGADPRHGLHDPPPPYNAGPIAHPHAAENDPEQDARFPLMMEENNNNEEEDNNNGDINGNSDMVDHNLVHHRQQQQQQQQIHAVANLDIHPAPTAALHRAAGPTSPVLPQRGASSVRASPVLWTGRQGSAMPTTHGSGSLSAVHQAALSPSRLLYPGDDDSSSDSD